MPEPTISVVIPTRNRAESLRATLTALASALRPNLPAEVIVVDNGSSDNTRRVIENFHDRLPLRLLEEPEAGKGACLNRALDTGSLGALVAVLDDDMSPDESWFEGVAAISKRWPDCDYFAGRIHVIWPDGPLPSWSQAPAIRSWAYSAFDYGPEGDRPIETGRWPCGGNFWFRSRVLRDGLRFDNIWLTEPRFILQLQERGARGIAGADARAGHRIQPELLSREFVRERAKQVGKAFAELRLRCDNVTKQGRLLRNYPMLFYTVCSAGLAFWSLAWLLAHVRLSPSRFAHILHATERRAAYSAFLKHAPEVQASWRLVRQSSVPHN